MMFKESKGYYSEMLNTKCDHIQKPRSGFGVIVILYRTNWLYKHTSN